MGHERSVIIQKYIESPFLINKRKFDLRIFGLIDHEMKSYIFKEGYFRLSSEIFDMSHDGLNNKYIHLTNNAI